jgi:signal transduction histidine kinase
VSERRILLVEDEPGYARLLREVLLDVEGERCVPVCVDTLEAALDRLNAEKFELILLDLGLPDADGTEALARVSERAPETPIVVLSALNDLDVAIESMRLGAQEYLVKGQAEYLLLPRAMRYAVERKRLQERVVAARAEAERANAVKDDFLAMLGHELRNPLAPIVTVLNVLERKGHADIQEELTILRRQVSHVILLVDDLLDVARIAQGKVELHRTTLDVADVVGAGLETAAPFLQERRHHVEVTVPRGRWFVQGDHARLAQVVANLLTNAAKYTDPGGHVRVAAHAAGEFVELEVMDDGIGMDRELLGQVFEVFVQGMRTLDRSAGGLGIGLSIVRSLVDLHGGSVSARSDGPGKGSQFTVRLPLHSAAVEERNAQRTTPPVDQATAALRVLIVDDNADGADMLGLGLRTLGHATRVAYDGPTALAVAQEFRPQVALLDIGLPLMDGFELARRMRAELGSESPVLIAVTGYGQDADRERTRLAGFAHHLVKPLELDALGALVGSALQP